MQCRLEQTQSVIEFAIAKIIAIKKRRFELEHMGFITFSFNIWWILFSAVGKLAVGDTKLKVLKAYLRMLVLLQCVFVCTYIYVNVLLVNRKKSTRPITNYKLNWLPKMYLISS